MRIRITIALFIFLNGLLSSQKLVDAQFLAGYTSNQVSALLGLPVPYDIDLYKIVYMTPNVEGEMHEASGLVCIPQAENTVFPMVCYQHGTVDGRFDVPSELAGGYELALALSAFGYISCAADFVGLGESEGVHPYVHSSTEATAGVDLLLAVREMSEDDNYPPFYFSDQLFLGGYSQGGHASMAAHRLIEESYSDVFNIAAAAHMSGPYSISEKMLEFTLGDQEYQTVAYLAWLVLGYQAAYPELLKDFDLEDIFKDQYLDDIYEFRDEEIYLQELNSRLSQKLIAEVGGVFPRALLKEEILNALLSNPAHPLSMALADNDTYDWSPKALTNLYYCEGDDQVTFENAVLAESVMTANGSTTVSAIRMDNASPLDHGGCIAPTVTAVVFYFAALQNISTSTEDLLAQNKILSFNDGMQLVTQVPFELDNGSLRLRIIDLQGQPVMAKSCEAGLTFHEISQLPAGMYLVEVSRSGQQLHLNRLIKN